MTSEEPTATFQILAAVLGENIATRAIFAEAAGIALKVTRAEHNWMLAAMRDAGWDGRVPALHNVDVVVVKNGEER